MQVRRIAILIIIAVGLAGNINFGQEKSEDLSANYGFGEMEVIKLDNGIANLRSADLNGDGKNDIIIANNAKARIELLLQREQSGPADEQVAVDLNDVDINQLNPNIHFKIEHLPVSQQMANLVCGDLNGDGLIDLAFYGKPEGLYVIYQKPSQKGKLTWSQAKKIRITDGLANSNSLICADLNNDGLKDLALAGREKIYTILQKKDGTLAEPVEYPVTAPVSGIESGDLNGDGINDLVILCASGEKRLHVRFGSESGQLGPEVQYFIEPPYALELSNIDNLPGDEVLTVDRWSGRLMCYKLAVAQQQKDIDWPILFYPLAAGQASTNRDLVIGDVDGDGVTDIVISDPAVAKLVLYKQKKGFGLTEPVRFPSLTDVDNLSAADIDGDKKTEIASLSVKEKIIGLSRFEDNRLTFPKPVDINNEPVAMELADVDSDKHSDLVYVSKDPNEVRTLRVIYELADYIKGGKKSKEAHTSEIELKKLTANPDGLLIADVDQDGLQDIMIFVKYEPLPILVRQSEKGKFEIADPSKTKASLVSGASLNSIFVENVDGKKGKELLLAQKNFARSMVFGKEGWSVIDQYNAKSQENSISAVAAFDIPGYSQPDKPAILLLDGTKGKCQILKAEEDKTYRFEKELDVDKWNSARNFKFLYASLTGNDVKNILLFDGEKFALITPPAADGGYSNMELMFAYETKIKNGVYGNLAVGDIHGDGRPDIVMVDYKNNNIEILALNAELMPVPAMRFKVFEEKGYRDEKPDKSGVEPRELKIADVSGHGKNDLITVIHDRIIIYPQD